MSSWTAWKFLRFLICKKPLYSHGHVQPGRSCMILWAFCQQNVKVLCPLLKRCSSRCLIFYLASRPASLDSGRTSTSNSNNNASLHEVKGMLWVKHAFTSMLHFHYFLCKIICRGSKTPSIKKLPLHSTACVSLSVSQPSFPRLETQVFYGFSKCYNCGVSF